MDSGKTLKERCNVSTGKKGDEFVGVKIDTDETGVTFPSGYQLSVDETDLRADILNLIGTLSVLREKDKKSYIETRSFEEPEKDVFPIHAYIKIITDYLRTGHYYIESDPEYKTDTKGKVSWARTIRDQQALLQKNGSPIYTKMTVRSKTPNIDKKITQIHRYCVYQAFDKLGWLYVSFMPEEPGTHPSNKEAISILTTKLASTYNDNEQDLFRAMINVLQYEDEKSDERQDFFGTEEFEHIWEKMVDRAFGVDNREQYLPKTQWLPDKGGPKTPMPLKPDTIMIDQDKYYVLDAKYYQYGSTGDADNLPGAADINKQITYGENVKKTFDVSNKNLFNAFIIPYNMHDNPFEFKNESIVKNFGEAIGVWRKNKKNYERVQGIFFDTRFLIDNYYKMPEEVRQELIKCIEIVKKRDPVSSD